MRGAHAPAVAPVQAALAALLTALLMVLSTSSALAGAPHKILVLPADGNAAPAARAKLTSQLSRLARSLDGELAVAEATFPDTALAVGCDPQAPACTDEVIATLGVDELVWATATRDAGQTRVLARRATRGAPPRTLTMAITTADPDARDRLDAGLAPLFAPPVAPGQVLQPPSPTAAGHAPAPALTEPPARQDDARGDRNVGIALATGGGVALVLGLALWVNYASLQDSINQHPTRTASDFSDLHALEDRAATYAITGDLAVALGLAVGGLGAYYLYRSHRGTGVALTPAPIAHGAGLTLTFVGDLGAR